MNIDLATLLDQFYRLMWPMLRIGALLMTAPVFSLRALNVRVRVLLAPQAETAARAAPQALPLAA